ncbi:hypothetical protein [Labrys sp. 22185]|uniref:hypothetical protein n=1 Tax=Labrys sp. 22185 TaxID=3453888 RepID=UPI003F83E629
MEMTSYDKCGFHLKQNRIFSAEDKRLFFDAYKSDLDSDEVESIIYAIAEYIEKNKIFSFYLYFNGDIKSLFCSMDLVILLEDYFRFEGGDGHTVIFPESNFLIEIKGRETVRLSVGGEGCVEFILDKLVFDTMVSVIVFNFIVISFELLRDEDFIRIYKHFFKQNI